jgi:hypothetical protein
MPGTPPNRRSLEDWGAHRAFQVMLPMLEKNSEDNLNAGVPGYKAEAVGFHRRDLVLRPALT